MSVLTQLLAAAPRYAQLRFSQYQSVAARTAATRARLAETLQAASSIPFYANRVRRDSGAGNLASWPILKRAAIAELNQSVRSVRPETPFASARSSGSTGAPAEFLFDAAHQRGRFAARARYLRAHGWSPWVRSAWTIALPDDVGEGQFVRSRLFPRAEFLKDYANFSDYVAWLCKVDPVYLCTLPSDLEGLVRTFELNRVRLPSLKKVLCGSEVLDDALRERTRRVLGVEVAEYYGSTEAFLAWQCPSGSFHINSEHVLLELVDDAGGPVRSGELGRVLVTTLENHLMPLVRYEIGDCAVASSSPCVCGRTLPTLGRVEGRTISLFYTTDGRLISPWRLIHRLSDCTEINQFQIVQKSLAHYQVRYVAEQPLRAELVTSLCASFRDMLAGDVTTTFDRVAEIARTRSGKTLSSICEWTPQARPLAPDGSNPTTLDTPDGYC
jgi:phenylacetate-CoA ligase